MNENPLRSVTVQFDTRVPAVYLYLTDPAGFQSHRTKQISKGLIVDLDEDGEVIGVELLGPHELESALEQALPGRHEQVLSLLRPKKKILEEILASTAA